jgi:hypothetical protein
LDGEGGGVDGRSGLVKKIYHPGKWISAKTGMKHQQKFLLNEESDDDKPQKISLCSQEKPG